MTISINALVTKNYVERIRSEADRRVVLVFLTPRGRKAYQQHKRFHDTMIKELEGSLDETQLQELEKSLNTLTDYFKKKQEIK